MKGSRPSSFGALDSSNYRHPFNHLGGHGNRIRLAALAEPGRRWKRAGPRNDARLASKVETSVGTDSSQVRRPRWRTAPAYHSVRKRVQVSSALK